MEADYLGGAYIPTSGIGTSKAVVVGGDDLVSQQIRQARGGPGGLAPAAMEERLTILSSDIGGSPDAVADLLIDARGISSWVEDWRRRREEMHSQSI
ncbi:hypothetical protein B0I37DRAFT_446281 [Chaetomium sp. MPI-CAGE-AT-0009]|nr:hypothetical protein B0I37DRAFT_446281 [Chaetomium sp. MPI-CAGE-AT-0009]